MNTAEEPNDAESFAAVHWLDSVTLHPSLSVAAKDIGAALYRHWAAGEASIEVPLRRLLRESGLVKTGTVRRGTEELRQHGFLAGQGTEAMPYRLRDPESGRMSTDETSQAATDLAGAMITLGDRSNPSNERVKALRAALKLAKENSRDD